MKKVFSLNEWVDNKSVLNEKVGLADIIDVLTNSMEFMDETDFADHMSSTHGWDQDLSFEVFNSYWDLGAKDRLRWNDRDWTTWLKKHGVKESVVTEGKKEEDMADDIFGDLLNNYEPFELQSMSIEDAKETVMAYKEVPPRMVDKVAKALVLMAQDFDYEEFFEGKVNEAGMNDPVLIAFRAAKMKREAELAKPKRKPLYGKQRLKAEDDLWYISQELKDLYSDRGQMLIDMEEEAEVEGGPIADEYGDKLNKIEDEIQKLIAKRNKLEMRLAESVVNEGKGAKNYFEDLKYNYTKSLRYLDNDEKKEYNKLAKDFFSKLAESVVNEAKFKAGDKWEWKHVDGNKTVEITDIKSNGDVIARVDGESQEFILREPNKYLKKKVNEAKSNAKMISKKEWDKTHKDYKTVINGQKYKMEYDEARDATILAPVEVSESVEYIELDEARSINKIQKDYTEVTSNMQSVVGQWKAAEGDKKVELLNALKALTSRKKALEKEIEEFVMGKDKDAELAGAFESLNEGSMGEIDIMAKTAKNFKAFVKEVMSEFKLEDSKELQAWLETIYKPYSN